jgi:hypothetical protein
MEKLIQIFIIFCYLLSFLFIDYKSVIYYIYSIIIIDLLLYKSLTKSFFFFLKINIFELNQTN